MVSCCVLSVTLVQMPPVPKLYHLHPICVPRDSNVLCTPSHSTIRQPQTSSPIMITPEALSRACKSHIPGVVLDEHKLTTQDDTLDQDMYIPHASTRASGVIKSHVVNTLNICPTSMVVISRMPIPNTLVPPVRRRGSPTIVTTEIDSCLYAYECESTSRTYLFTGLFRNRTVI
jgi:hypothetical protein